jgi:hypothetical protein
MQVQNNMQMQNMYQVGMGQGQGGGQGKGMGRIMQSLTPDQRQEISSQLQSLSQDDRKNIVDQIKQLDPTSMSQDQLFQLNPQTQATAAADSGINIYA